MIAPINKAMEKLLLTQAEAADSLQVCEKTLWSLSQPRGPIPVVRLGRVVRYSPAALQAWIQAQEAPA